MYRNLLFDLLPELRTIVRKLLSKTDKLCLHAVYLGSESWYSYIDKIGSQVPPFDEDTMVGLFTHSDQYIRWFADHCDAGHLEVLVWEHNRRGLANLVTPVLTDDEYAIKKARFGFIEYNPNCQAHINAKLKKQVVSAAFDRGHMDLVKIQTAISGPIGSMFAKTLCNFRTNREEKVTVLLSRVASVNVIRALSATLQSIKWFIIYGETELSGKLLHMIRDLGIIDDLISVAILHANVDFLDAVSALKLRLTYDDSYPIMVAKIGNINVAKWLIRAFPQENVIGDIISSAVRHKNDNMFYEMMDLAGDINKVNLNLDVVLVFASYDILEWLTAKKWKQIHNFMIPTIINVISIDMIKYRHVHGDISLVTDSILLSAHAYKKNIEMIEFALTVREWCTARLWQLPMIVKPKHMTTVRKLLWRSPHLSHSPDHLYSHPLSLRHNLGYNPSDAQIKYAYDVAVDNIKFFLDKGIIPNPKAYTELSNVPMINRAFLAHNVARKLSRYYAVADMLVFSVVGYVWYLW